MNQQAVRRGRPAIRTVRGSRGQKYYNLILRKEYFARDGIPYPEGEIDADVEIHNTPLGTMVLATLREGDGRLDLTGPMVIFTSVRFDMQSPGTARSPFSFLRIITFNSRDLRVAADGEAIRLEGTTVTNDVVLVNVDGKKGLCSVILEQGEIFWPPTETYFGESKFTVATPIDSVRIVESKSGEKYFHISGAFLEVYVLWSPELEESIKKLGLLQVS